MSNIFDMFETDPQLEKDGVTLDYGTNSKGEPMVIRVARAGGANVLWLQAYEHVTKPYRRQIDADLKLPRELNEKLDRELYARAVVRHCSGFEERDGTPIPTSTPAEIIEFFTRLPNLFSDVKVFASKMTNYRDEQREVDAGN